ncbi:hypothetical protein [Streptomyces canus]|uniref:hypothetical protein n=1 Tax=Streptomyces canus TaxID=58343 RepID=UPI00324E259C
MTQLRHARWSMIVIMAVIAAMQLWAVPAASARVTSGGEGHLAEPHKKIDGVTGSDAMGEGWYRSLSLPAAENPAFGNGDRCVKIGRTGKVLLAIGNGPPQTCTVPEGTAVFVIGIMAFCDNVEAPPWYGADEAAQRECAWAVLRSTTESVQFTVDGGKAIDLQKRRFEICAPLRAVQLLPDNILGVPPQPATFTACGWVAWLTDLAPGRHVLHSEATFNDGPEHHVWSPVIEVTE